MNIAIIDYKAGNLRNVQKALESLGADAYIVSTPESLVEAEGILLPGVGSFYDGMTMLQSTGLADAIRIEVEKEKKPLLGICLGMQLLGMSGNEGGEIEGLGLLPMNVLLFDTQDCTERLPHMGWNSVFPKDDSCLFRGIPKGADFYFAHSYHVECQDGSILAATCDYCYSFGAAVQKDHVFATQFHPEKSQRYGYIVLDNFLTYCREVKK